MPTKRTKNWKHYFPTLQQPLSSPDDEGITNDPTWRKGDFEIISSDAVRFLVDSHRLEYSSAFHAAIHAHLGTAILTDAVIEKAPTVKAFLSLATHTLSIPPSCIGLRELLAFLTKWGATSLLPRFWSALESAIRSRKVWAPWAFQTAAFGDNAALCDLVLRIEAHNLWAQGIGTGTPGKSVWDPDHWPTRFLVTPPMYLRALERAWESTVKMGGVESIADVEGLAGEFARFLAIAKSPSMALHVHHHTEKDSG
ncbi:hypothetical protein CcaverHIS002_0602710 [Cutaneotrichosporon cavernicola]|uniref:BTB domain-containing protein n=1 Tax=Cutaneotrichosporon cavernicola TaxID=279322 RepID=A0AA48L8A0_9TREE|nr:uncharacterized protein CcaverHIS019_0602190 [Cutaneotrichosporon cavernicola]BEI85984.1 hypothetical protein CcaverHIS002_0602710 [Cutaneotrichosporon cavernicola]BEI93760.1 hypothetical protein CcaverHIS019_0602190 [Cutaneotrichosporon cavernicola]BEJ01538.1 hypothetical protein CcaverHIS631_0602200 [Cutaneotrichosporon cavernicola]